mmetsp:Transcript_7144/g.17250  ORF Transcript_7144/g.17250 Transcript_7144/m.17250 type:complete len:233 (-) Transcript_7144:2521-3219(-)
MAGATGAAGAVTAAEAEEEALMPLRERSPRAPATCRTVPGTRVVSGPRVMVSWASSPHAHRTPSDPRGAREAGERTSPQSCSWGAMPARSVGWSKETETCPPPTLKAHEAMEGAAQKVKGREAKREASRLSSTRRLTVRLPPWKAQTAQVMSGGSMDRTVRVLLVDATTTDSAGTSPKVTISSSPAARLMRGMLVTAASKAPAPTRAAVHPCRERQESSLRSSKKEKSNDAV